MSLQTIYESFLENPAVASLAETVSLNYITTLTTINHAEPVTAHLQTQNKSIVKKRAEKVIGAVEGPSSVSLDVETTLEFISGGGAYLPGLENFVTDKVVTFPAIHTVHFDQDNKIKSIRLYWDQGALLKQVGVIGSRGNNWPIHDGKDQARLISSVPSTTRKAPQAPAPVTRGRNTDEVVSVARNASPNKKHIKDPYASLDLFGGEKADPNKRGPLPGATAPRKSAKPPPREMSELFAAGREDHEQGPPGSPAKDNRSPVMAPKAKGTGGQNYQPSRLFDFEPDRESPALYKSNPANYDHFELGNASDVDHFQHGKAPVAGEHVVPMRAKTNKHTSQWAFEDFVTPEKVHTKSRGQDARNFGWSDDEGEKAETPGKHPKVVQPRPDSQVHFELQDDGAPVGDRHPAGRAKGSQHNNGLGLYQNNLYEDGLQIENVPKENEPLKNVTNNISRNKDFDSHWIMADSSPVTDGKTNKENKPLGENHQKAVNMMTPHWDTHDESPEQIKKPAKGLRKGQETHWGFDNHASEQSGGKKEGGNFWDF